MMYCTSHHLLPEMVNCYPELTGVVFTGALGKTVLFTYFVMVGRAAVVITICQVDIWQSQNTDLASKSCTYPPNLAQKCFGNPNDEQHKGL